MPYAAFSIDMITTLGDRCRFTTVRKDVLNTSSPQKYVVGPSLDEISAIQRHTDGASPPFAAAVAAVSEAGAGSPMSSAGSKQPFGLRRYTSSSVPAARQGGVVEGTRQLRIFRNGYDWTALAATTWRQCLLGGLLGLGGAAAAASALATSPPLAAAVACAGSLAPCAALWWVPRQMRNIAACFVEEMLVFIPWPDKPSAKDEEDRRTATGPAEGPACAVSKETVRASSELLAARLRSVASVSHASPCLSPANLEAQQAKPLLRRAGFVADSRPSFRHLCSLPISEGGQSRVGRRGPLHINPTEGLSTDPALLAALLRSPKVLAAEHMESRETVSCTEGELLRWRLPESLDELTEGFQESPQKRMERLGRRCLLLGAVTALCGMLANQDPVNSLIRTAVSPKLMQLIPASLLGIGIVDAPAVASLGSALDAFPPEPLCASVSCSQRARKNGIGPSLARQRMWFLNALTKFIPASGVATWAKDPWGTASAGQGGWISTGAVARRRACGQGVVGNEDMISGHMSTIRSSRHASTAQPNARTAVKRILVVARGLQVNFSFSRIGLSAGFNIGLFIVRGWTYFPENWEPIGCRLPAAAILGLRRVCVLRATTDAPWSPHAGVIYGLRDCADPVECLHVGRDRVGADFAFLKEVPTAAACRLRCQATEECRAFSYFPDGYLGDSDPGCVLPGAVFSWWKTRCLLKIHKTKPGHTEQWLEMGNVASGQRGCRPARPWQRWAATKQLQDDLLAVDGDYRRERCSRRQPWRLELDAEYIVTRVMLWTGQLNTLPFREPLVYEVTLIVGEEELLCGSADENLGGNAVVVHCASETSRKPATGVMIRSSAGPADEFALCEVELQVAPVPCDLLLHKGWTIHGRVVFIFPPAEASRATLTGAGEACERMGGSMGPTSTHVLTCVVPSCNAPALSCIDPSWPLVMEAQSFHQERRRVLLWIAACCYMLGRGSVFVPPPPPGPSNVNALRAAAPLGALAVLAPAAAHAEAVEATIEPQDAIVQAFALTFVSEIGDKTFFIAAILAAGSSAADGLSQKVLTFIGAICALAVMTFIAVSIGQIFHAVPDAAGGLPLDDYASILAFGYFGVKLLLDASTMPDDGSILAEEKEEAEEAVNESLPEWVTKLAIPALVVQAFILVFAAEVGDRSFISAAALSAQGGPEGAAAVFVGSIAAHAIATLLAVALGDLISTYVSEKTLTYIGGGLFLFFAATSTVKELVCYESPTSFGVHHAPYPAEHWSQIEPGDPLDDAKGIRTSSERTYSLHAQALQKLVTMTKSASSSRDTGSREQASVALRQLFGASGLSWKSGDQDINEMDTKLQALLEKILAQRGEPVAATSTPPVSSESVEELVAKLGPESLEPKKPEPPRRRLVLTEEGGMLASVRVKVLEASKALRAKDNTVTQLTQKLKQCRKEVWDLQCEANAADLRVARILQQHAETLPEKYRKEFEELKEKEEELADELAVARAEAQRWASVAKRQDAMLQQEREEQRGADAKSILMKHPAGEVFWMPGPDSDSEDDAAAIMKMRGRAEDVNLASSDEESDRPTRADLAKAKARFEAERRLDDSDSPSDDSIDEPVRPIRIEQGAREAKPDKEEAPKAFSPPAKTVPPLPGLSSLPARPGFDDAEEDVGSSGGDCGDGRVIALAGSLRTFQMPGGVRCWNRGSIELRRADPKEFKTMKGILARLIRLSSSCLCQDALHHSQGRMFEATVMIYNGGHPDVGGSQMTTHWCAQNGFCPSEVYSINFGPIKVLGHQCPVAAGCVGKSSRCTADPLHAIWYYVPGRTLGPLLRAQWSPTPHRILEQKSTKELFEACASRQEEQYFYSGLAEGAGGRLHEDVQSLVGSFADAVRAVAAKGLEAKANVWISCPSTGASTHYDMGHNVVVQISGTKTFELLPPRSLQTLPIPPTGHPYARQVMNDAGFNFSTVMLEPGDALYLPPLWAHRTSSGVEGPSISLNVFIGSAAEDVSEELSKLPLPFEEDWPTSVMHASVATYLLSFLTEAGVDLTLLERRWSLVELKEERREIKCGSCPTVDRVRARGKDAASRVKVLPVDHQLPIVLDYADDVMIGILDPSLVPAFLHKLPGHSAGGATWPYLGGSGSASWIPVSAAQALQPNSEIECGTHYLSIRLSSERGPYGWEDVQLDFLVAGFARSGTHSLRGNMMEHPQVNFAELEMTFNWAALPQQVQVRHYASFFKDEEGSRQSLKGGKGEGLALSQRALRLASKIPNLRLVVMVREPVEWLESLYNLRKFYQCQNPSDCSEVPSLQDVIFNGVTFEDVNVEDAFLSRSLEHVVKFFPPSAGRSLLLEFELLRHRPRELFDQLTRFLGSSLAAMRIGAWMTVGLLPCPGIEPFPADFELKRHAVEDRQR
ncbi:unnamed protein product [Symbiodinium natans]|uniref:JmjC domain-containing protein n=1 Tax=Symbiodinium natans TaxID=878477 RepID=A0A812T741_9DINO|nr:unnamed protein product [Symbiodinium natans]